MRQYLVNLLMGIDQFVSTILGGHPDDTISQRLGRAKVHGGGVVVNFFSLTVDSIAYFLAGESNHCVASLSGKTSAKEIWNWGGDRSDIKVT